MKPAIKKVHKEEKRKDKNQIIFQEHQTSYFIDD
jgi:hypothetical protein